MNRKVLSKVVSLFRQGVPAEICASIIIDLMRLLNLDNLSIGKAIHEFYAEIYTLDIKQKR